MQLQEIGSMLRQERERQGLSVDDVIHRTKISRRNIQALEEGDEGRLPHPVYARGFVKSYAQTLGLNEREIGCAFADVYGLDEEEECPPEEAIHSQEEFTSPRKGPLLLLLAGVLLLIAAMGGYFIFTGSDQNRVAEAPPVTAGVASESEEPAPTQEKEQILPPQVPEEEAPSVEVAPPSAPMEEQEQLAEQQEDSFPETPETESRAATPPVDQSMEQPGEERPASVATKTLTVKASDECWLQANVDKQPREVLLQEGQQVEFTFQDTLLLRLGNAGGIELLYNGKPYPLDAAPGEVRTLLFPPTQQ